MKITVIQNPTAGQRVRISCIWVIEDVMGKPQK
jgi:hypothetical protein